MLVMSNIRIKKKINKAIFYSAMIIAAVIYLVPVFFVLVTSLKTQGEIRMSPFALPKIPQWINYVTAWTEGKIGLYLKNSIVITVVSVPLTILVASLATYALTRLNFKYENIVFLLFVICMVVPLQVILVPLMTIIRSLKLLNTYYALWLIYTGVNAPLCILVLRGFFRTIPAEIDNAAKIDGCSSFQTFWRIIMPLSKPALSTVIILMTLTVWNEFLLAQLFLQKVSLRPITMGVLAFKGEYNINYSVMTAGVIMSILPMMAVYLTFQKYFVQGLSGMLKG